MRAIPISRGSWLALWLILIGFGLRLYRLDYADITGDEAWSVTVAGWELEEVVASDAEFNPPLYHVLLHGMMRLAGESTFAIRYLSVTAGVLGLALLGRIGWLVGGHWLGLLSLLAGAFSPFLIYYAQEARFYSLVLSTSAASFLLLVRLLRQQQSSAPAPMKLWLLYGLASLVMLFSHYYAFAMMSAQAAFVISWHAWHRRWRPLRDWLLVWFSMALVYLPWLVYSARFLNTRTYERYDQWSASIWLDLAQRTLRAFGASITMPSSLAWVGRLVVALAVIGVVSLWRHQRRSRYLALLPAAVVLGVITFAWGMNPILPFFYERYLLVGMPAFVLLVAAGLWGLFRLQRASGVLALLLLLGIAGTSLWHQWFHPDYLKGSYGRLMADIENRSRPGDLILLHNPLQESLAEIYLPDEMPSLILDRGRLLSMEEVDEYLEKITQGYARVWLVEYGDPNEYDPSHRVVQWLGQQGSRAYYQNYINSGPLYLFVLGETAEGRMLQVKANLHDEIWLDSARLPEVVEAGQPLLLELTWRAQAPISRDYTVFTHLLSPAGELVAQTDTQPGGGGNPTSSWTPGESNVDKYAILVPESVVPGSYRVRVGMYLWPELTRLPVVAAQMPVTDDAVDLGAVHVE